MTRPALVHAALGMLAAAALGLPCCAPADSGSSAGDTASDRANAQPDDAPTAASTTPAPGPAPVEAPSAELIALGSTTFNTGFCAKCHMEGGVGSDRAPSLTDDEWVHCDGSIDGIMGVIRSGVPEDKLSKPSYPFAMNPVPADKIPDDVARAVAAYIWSLSRGGS